MSSTKALAGLLLAFCAIAAPHPVRAQTDGSCAVCIVQVGNSNAVLVDVDGQRNGGGTLGGQVSPALTILNSAPNASPAAPIAVPSMLSGTVTQIGNGNRAQLLVRGDDNQFLISQDGDGNDAVQVVVGDRNEVSAVQSGVAGLNFSTQIIVGADSVNHIAQAGGNNLAVAQQVPTAELALLGLDLERDGPSLLAAIGMGGTGSGADGNSILLEQNGGGNEAVLTQIGFDHGIALRQQGNAQIGITQLGFGKYVGIEQSAGSTGVQILQY